MVTIKDCLEKISMTFGENKMNKFKVGDKVNITDGSYCFGIQNGKYSQYCNCRNGDRNNLTVVTTDLFVVKLKDYKFSEQNHIGGQFTAVNDLLVTDNKGSFWFTQSRFCESAEPSHTITIDGKTIRISHESFLALKKQLV